MTPQHEGETKMTDDRQIPQPSTCATCFGTGDEIIDGDGAEFVRSGRPCPSCTPPDPESETP